MHSPSSTIYVIVKSIEITSHFDYEYVVELDWASVNKRLNCNTGTQLSEWVYNMENILLQDLHFLTLSSLSLSPHQLLCIQHFESA